MLNGKTHIISTFRLGHGFNVELPEGSIQRSPTLGLWHSGIVAVSTHHEPPGFDCRCRMATAPEDAAISNPGIPKWAADSAGAGQGPNGGLVKVELSRKDGLTWDFELIPQHGN